MADKLTILHMQVFYLVLVISDPASLLALCSRGGKILFIVKKPHRLCCHQKLINKIKPTILGVDNRLVE